MRKYLVLMGIILFSAALKAETVEINGVYYNLVNKTSTAEVTSNPNGYKGHVEIPASVECDGKSYVVISIGNNAFSSNSELTSIAIPATIESIGEYNQEIKGETNVEIIPVSA